MTIKFKLLGIAAGVAVLLAILMGLGTLAMERLTAIKDTEVQVASSEAGMLLLRRREKDFLARLDPKYFKSFQKDAATLQTTLATLSGLAKKAGISHEKADQAAELIGEYGKVFGDLVAAQEANGFDAQSGLRGEAQAAAARMRKVTDQLEVPTVLMDNLEMNLAEAAFFNQPDQSSVDRFRRFAGQLKNTLSILGASDIDRDSRKELMASLAAYEGAFAAMAAKQQEIGFSEKEGLRGQMRGTVHKTETLFKELSEETRVAAAASVKQLYSVAVILFLVLVVVLAVAALLMARSIIKPVEALRDTMLSVQRDHDLSLRADASGRDEITAMGKAFNEMMDAFQQTVRTVQDASAQMSSSAEELSAITEQTSQGLMQQQGEVDQVATAINEMEATMAEVARNTEATAETSSRANDHATEGRSIVEQTIDVIQTLVAQAQQSSRTTTELKSESEEVVTVLDVIKAIADQTNLLALNAAIEAARAGEQGRGFAVVADEVRTLAQRSQKSATEIEEIISRLQGKTDEVVTAIESSRTQAEQCIQQALKAGDALSKITEAAGEIQQMTTQIASATEEQSAVAREINTNVTSIKMISDQSSGAVQQNSVASGEVAKQAAMLHSSIEQFRV